MNVTTRLWLVVLATAVVAGAVGAGVTWAVQAKRLEAARTTAEGLQDELTAARDELGELQSGTASEATPAQSPATTSPPAPAPAEETQTASEGGRFFCFIKSAEWSGSTPRLTVDYAEMLSGKAAADAAAAAGAESPPPNDYFISNKNKKLRTFPVNKSMKVKMVSAPENLIIEGYPMAFSAWFDAFTGQSGSFPAIKTVPYWITVKNGTIVKMEEQFLP